MQIRGGQGPFGDGQKSQCISPSWKRRHGLRDLPDVCIEFGWERVEYSLPLGVMRMSQVFDKVADVYWKAASLRHYSVDETRIFSLKSKGLTFSRADQMPNGFRVQLGKLNE